MIHVNGEPSSVPAGETVAAVVAALGVERGARGVAVAVNGEVVPRGAWDARVVPDGASVEVLTAMQGG
jgi:sulfur carrier protein